jgi:XTP/dITP diphosphohydrolase
MTTAAPRRPILVLGTANRKKGMELAGLLSATSLDLKTLADFPESIPVVEDGRTFAENATRKATQQARHLRLWVLADDSGLAVDALGGEPGVASSRYSGPRATDASNNRLLLEKLAGVLPAGRTAQFVCHVALADPSGAVRAETEAACRGRILAAPEGTGGFGYDPLFEIVEYHRSFGSLSPLVKSCLSHRARAVALLIPRLIELMESGQWDGPW